MTGKSRKSEEERRSDLIAATIREVGRAGSLDIPTSQIAKSAGVSPGLVFHYFGDKEGLFISAMRSILSDYGSDVRAAFAVSRSSQERVEAIVTASFAQTSLAPETIAAWVNFYALALRSDPASRLLHIYYRRLHSNLTHALRPIIGDRAPEVSRRAASLIDGLYLRFALDAKSNRSQTEAFDGPYGARHVLALLSAECAFDTARTQKDPAE